MKKIITGVLLSISILFALQNVTPTKEIDVDGVVKDMVLRGNNLIIGTDSGKLEVYDYKQQKFIYSISIPNIKDFMGDIIPARVASVDYIDGKYLLLSDSGIGGYANLRIHQNGKTVDIITHKDKMPIIKARFIDKDHILLGYLSNEVSLFDINTKKEIYKKQLSQSKFSDFALNSSRTLAAFSCESGEITVIDPKDGKIIRRFSDMNVDNVYKVDIKNGYVSGAGQDRRGSWYEIKSGKGGYFQGKFLIYATALSPNASKVAYAMDIQNNITVYDMLTKSKVAILKGQKSTLNVIIFKDEHTLFSASDDNTIMQWHIN